MEFENLKNLKKEKEERTRQVEKAEGILYEINLRIKRKAKAICLKEVLSFVSKNKEDLLVKGALRINTHHFFTSEELEAEITEFFTTVGEAGLLYLNKFKPAYNMAHSSTKIHLSGVNLIEAIEEELKGYDLAIELTKNSNICKISIA